ncbi:MAG: YciI family protein [Candidatus Eremiobacteraeota bacterium]|nr:YciI family protein [Candidatus Eremiobacteraeota bacterium]MBV8645135.1 YciI family protein [Candidatus Eremiobacteraeota bacterium]
MQYLLLCYVDDEKRSYNLSGDEGRALYGSYVAYRQALQDAGVFVGSNALQAVSTATQVRVSDGKTTVLDGPYPDTKEQLGGYFLIEAPDLDSALAWAARCPAATEGTVEVRPIMPTPVSV